MYRASTRQCRRGWPKNAPNASKRRSLLRCSASKAEEGGAEEEEGANSMWYSISFLCVGRPLLMRHHVVDTVHNQHAFSHQVLEVFQWCFHRSLNKKNTLTRRTGKPRKLVQMGLFVGFTMQRAVCNTHIKPKSVNGASWPLRECRCSFIEHAQRVKLDAVKQLRPMSECIRN